MPEQFGFREKHSTTDQLRRVVEFLSKNYNSKIPTGAIFLDISKAFDKVIHSGLIFKLIHYNIPDAFIHLIHSYNSNRKFCVKVKNSISSIAGDLPRTSTTHLACYADDTCIYTADKYVNSIATYLQHHIDLLEDWCVKWKVKINPDKSHAIFFSRKIPPPPVSLFRIMSLSGKTLRDISALLLTKT